MPLGRRAGYRIAATAAVVVLGGVTTAAAAILPASGRAACAEFTDAVGLYPGNDVSLLGVRIGRVTAIEPRGDRVLVRMTLDRGSTLPADTGAVTLSTSIVTDRRVELTTPYTGGPHLGEDCIPLARTKTPLGVSRALESVDRLSTALVGPTEPDGTIPGAQLLGDTLRAADAVTAGTGAEYNQLLHRTALLMADPAAIDGRTRRLVDNLNRLTGSFVTNWPDLQAVLDHLRDTIEMIAGVSQGLGHALDQANDLLPVLTRTVSRFDDRAYALLDQAVPLTQHLLARTGDIREVLALLPQTAQAMRTLLPLTGEGLHVRYRPPQFEVTVDGTPQRVDLLAWLLGLPER
ncbi:MCE family protein [Nocardia sp. NPDC050712]|uniref:MCE family protein n=1 Tax=Nocardia sp. NPDC050712 TaxID=3155518 RepID=UPI0033F1D295